MTEVRTTPTGVLRFRYVGRLLVSTNNIAFEEREGADHRGGGAPKGKRKQRKGKKKGSKVVKNGHRVAVHLDDVISVQPSETRDLVVEAVDAERVRASDAPASHCPVGIAWTPPRNTSAW